jgi:hypothetical protein
MEGWECQRQPFAKSFTMSRLHLLPGLALAASEQVRMSALHLRHERSRHVVDVEGAVLFGDYGVKEHLEQYVAELLAHRIRTAGAQSVVQLEGFFDEIWAQRRMRLSGVPLASLPQVAHDGQRIE